jgi:hypothetical protein
LSIETKITNNRTETQYSNSTNMITTELPAGLIDDSAEMYSHNNMLMALRGGVTVPVISCNKLKHPVLDHMMNRPEAHKAIQQWVGNDVDDQINRYGQCLWGAFNSIPDMDENGNMSDPEFIQCSKKGNCPYEKAVCGCFQQLSKAEERILPHVLWADRIIGATLNVSPLTVTAQIKSIKKKINVETKAEVVNWANLNGIKLCK